MALELLSGPSPVLDGDGDPLNISETCQHDDSFGIAAYQTGFYSYVQWDGKTYARAAMPRAEIYVLDLQDDVGNWLIIEALFLDKIYAFDKRTGAFGALLYSGATAAMNGIQARCTDRFLSVLATNVRARPLDLSTAFATETALVGAGSGYAFLSRTRQANILCVAYETGEILYYDHVNQVQIAGEANVGANNGCWYSPRHDVFVVLTGTGTNYVSVYANSVVPSTLSNPTAYPSLLKGKRSTISVTLTGASGDAVVGELIDWTLTGPGTLLATQSETDENGVASVTYIAPLVLSVNPQFEASVTF